ncbi:RNA polymerase sigma factor SigJ [Azospirillum thermophilum]|uniref:RNA polymerase sigma factor SigJ n=1 Tax=Azospirillum thermophilum TaxID=2202148 RepID=UPI001FE8D2B6|nr:RNA polymerase sigma factor SigJ [Azospirillum thermophilum]
MTAQPLTEASPAACGDEDGRARLDLFRSERARLRALAYRMTGSVSDAEDIVQDAWLRLTRIDPQAIEAPRAFLTTLVTRLALDRLRSARHTRERYVGLWLPEPEVSHWDQASWADGPPDSLAERDAVPFAMLLLLETLTPEQRAVFVLREAMDLDHGEIAAILGKTPEACRQILRRARARIAEQGPATTVRHPPARSGIAAAGRKLAEAFAEASARRDYAGIVALLGEQAEWLSDGGGVVRTARNRLVGPDRIARFLIGIQRKYDTTLEMVPVLVNGGPGLMTSLNGTFRSIIGLEVADGRILRLFQVLNPEKLRHLETAAASG